MVGYLHYLILFGGEGEEGDLNDIWLFDLKKNLWDKASTTGTSPSPRKGHSCALYNIDPLALFIISGGISQGQYSNQIYILKLQPGKNSLQLIWVTQEFQVIGTIPPSTEGHIFFQTPNSLLQTSGCNYSLSTCYGTTYSLQVSLSPIKQLIWGQDSFQIQKQEKPLILPTNSQIFVIPGHSKSNHLIKQGKIIRFNQECNGQGVFENNQCKCFSGYYGPTCEETSEIFLQGPCEHNCRNRGSCANGLCKCLSEYFGPTCEYKHCSSTCGAEDNRGTCDHESGTCKCQNTYGGEHCQHTCPYGCPDGLMCIFPYQCACHNCPVSSLHCNEQGTLVGNECQCIPGFCGKFCQDSCPSCSGHGEYTGSCCKCFSGYYGPACENMCPNRCSSHGTCSQGLCECDMGWEGEDCSKNFTCIDCAHGTCVHGNCQCYQGYTGENCEILACPMNCTILSTHYEVYADTVISYQTMEEIPISQLSRHIIQITNTAGFCNLELQKCECYNGYIGKNCADVEICKGNCNSQGKCEHGKCHCFEGFFGENCEKDECGNTCGPHGSCVNGKCKCPQVWAGKDCNTCACKHGSCNGENCICQDNWTGEVCDIKPCESCSNGICIDGICICQEGYSGVNCNECIDFLGCSRCTDNKMCGTGTCVQGRCLCDSHHTGKSCEILLCSGNGIMHHGGCICESGYTGNNCSIPLTCPNLCSQHGVCHTGICYCDPDYTGTDCSQKKSCPSGCNNNGICKFGKCYCNYGFQGPSCEISSKAESQKKCEEDCKGYCLSGKCYCLVNSELIETSICPLECSHKGKCIGNVCYCDQGWTGEACEVHMIQDNSAFCMDSGVECSGKGICNNGKCFCNPGFSGEFCESNTECLMCNGPNQVCKENRCECVKGWGGVQCLQEDSCADLYCGEFGSCKKGECLCKNGYSSRNGNPCAPEFVNLLGIAFAVSLAYAGFIVCLVRVCKK